MQNYLCYWSLFSATPKPCNGSVHFTWVFEILQMTTKSAGRDFNPWEVCWLWMKLFGLKFHHSELEIRRWGYCVSFTQREIICLCNLAMDKSEVDHLIFTIELSLYCIDYGILQQEIGEGVSA